VRLVELRESGLYCPPADSYIDPWGPVERAIITHAHPEHASAGSGAYLSSSDGEPLLRALVGPDAAIQTAAYGEAITINEVKISFHPAGHMLGSAQIRLERSGEIWVVSGDYQLQSDPTCAPFEPVRCHTFVTESAFGLPIFRWPIEPIGDINAWWRANQQAGKSSVLFLHPIGMAQQVLASIDGSVGAIHAHEVIEPINQIYRAQGVGLPSTSAKIEPGGMILAPLSAHGSTWARSLKKISDAMVSGWMRIRGPRRRRSLDRGFAFSNHADWPGLLRAIDETAAETILVTHAHRVPLARWLEEHGRRAFPLDAPYQEVEL